MLSALVLLHWILSIRMCSYQFIQQYGHFSTCLYKHSIASEQISPYLLLSNHSEPGHCADPKEKYKTILDRNYNDRSFLIVNIHVKLNKYTIFII